jgi:hypothetical protein
MSALCVKLLNLKPSKRTYLRNAKGLPYVKLSLRERVSLEEDLMAYFRDHRSVCDASQPMAQTVTAGLSAPKSSDAGVVWRRSGDSFQ